MTILVRKIGGSLGVVIPKAVVREMELSAGASLTIRTGDGEIVMRKRPERVRRPIGQIVAQIKRSSYRRHGRELAEDRPVGREVW